MIAPLEVLPLRSSTAVRVLRMFQRPLDNAARPTRDDLLLVPAVIRERNHWVLWDYENSKNGKPTKVLYRPSRRGWKAKVNDPTTWGAFDLAVQNMNGHAGVGCV